MCTTHKVYMGHPAVAGCSFFARLLQKNVHSLQENTHNMNNVR